MKYLPYDIMKFPISVGTFCAVLPCRTRDSRQNRLFEEAGQNSAWNFSENVVYIYVRRYSAAATAGVAKIEGGTNGCDHRVSFKSLSRATPCISSLKKRILSPVVENKNIGLAVSLFCLHIGEEYFHWLIKNNQPMRTFLANAS